MPALIPVMMLVLFNAPAAAGDGYVHRNVEGWTARVDPALLDHGTPLGREAIRLLGAQLANIKRAVPGRIAARLRDIVITMDLNHEPWPGAVYHPSREWLEEHGHDPSLAGSVHIANATHFVKWSREQPWMVMHEMAHAYHHQVLGHDHAGIREAFENAVERGLYESVLRYDGSEARAYAMNNEQEFFAEATEAFLGVNDFFPFVRAELRRHDPVTYELMVSIWGDG